MVAIILAVSITVNLFLLGLVLVLFWKKCRKCDKDKEISRVFNTSCEKCGKGINLPKGNGKTDKKKEQVEIF